MHRATLRRLLVRVLLVINATREPVRERKIAAGRYPRRDYHELQRATGADIADLAMFDARRWMRLARRFAGPSVAQAPLAWTLSRHYDAVFADQEPTGFLLAALCKQTVTADDPDRTGVRDWVGPAILNGGGVATNVLEIAVHGSAKGWRVVIPGEAGAAIDAHASRPDRSTYHCEALSCNSKTSPTS